MCRQFLDKTVLHLVFIITRFTFLAIVQNWQAKIQSLLQKFCAKIVVLRATQ